MNVMNKVSTYSIQFETSKLSECRLIHSIMNVLMSFLLVLQLSMLRAAMNSQNLKKNADYVFM